MLEDYISWPRLGKKTEENQLFPLIAYSNNTKGQSVATFLFQ